MATAPRPAGANAARSTEPSLISIAALAAAGLNRMSFHDTRHGAATLLLAQGVPFKVVQEALGHATIAVTADVYGHLLPELQRDAAGRMEKALAEAV